MREAEIRPAYLARGQLVAAEADLGWLLRRRDGFVNVPCPACEAQDTSGAFEKRSLTYVTCLSCDTMYINPRPTLEILEAYHARSEGYRYWNEQVFPATEEVRQEKIFRPRAEQLARVCLCYGVGSGTLIEVGAGFGTFCEEVRSLKLFHRIIAIEPVPGLAETCRRRGLEVIEDCFEGAYLEPEAADVVVSFEVIEHLFSPRDFVLGCAKVLLTGGLLIITCPNVKGFDVMMLQSNSSTVDHEHLNYFHPASLSHLVEECGFEVLEVSTPGRLDAELVREKVLIGELDVSPFLRRVLEDEWKQLGDNFQQFLADNLLSSHMWLVARKRR